VLKDNADRIRGAIADARRRAGREDEVALLCATKGVAPDRLRETAELGLTLFGENRIQDALPKIAALEGTGIVWHFIGSLQKNKAAVAVEHFTCVQSVDSVGLARKLQGAAMQADKVLPVFIEINIGDEPLKGGTRPADLPALVEELGRLDNLRFEGLMCIPPYHPDPERSRPYFSRMREIYNRLSPLFPTLAHLSMGMSEDYAVAVEEGATMVRVGRALFGERV
jgi:PLP dependent protein